MAVPVEELLSLSRELERVRDQLPAPSVERTEVVVQIAALRKMQDALGADARLTAGLLRECRETIDRGFAALAAAHERLQRR